MLNIRPETTHGVYLGSIQARVLKRVTPYNGAIHRAAVGVHSCVCTHAFV